MGTVEGRGPMGTKMIFVSFFFFFFAATHAFPRPNDGPLNMEALSMLHADAVKFGDGAKDNEWFAAIGAKTLDQLITEMNTMNRWFAKVVKYWDEFTSGGDGSKVLKELGDGIKEDDEESAGNSKKEAAADGEGEAAKEGEEGDAAAEGDDAEAKEGEEGDAAAEGDDAEAKEEEGEAAAEGEDAEAKEGEEGDAAADGEGEEEKKADAARRMRRMRRRL